MRVLLASIIVILLVAAGGIYYFYPALYGIRPDSSNTPNLSDLVSTNKAVYPSENTSPSADIPAETIIAEGLDTPWAIAFLPDKSMLVTERPGRVRLVDSSGKLQNAPVATLNQVKEIGEGGLLGIALHPDFANDNYIYFYYTYSGNEDNTLNRVARMKYENNQLKDEQIIVDNIPGASFHNGGRIKFGPDKFLYITTGDAQNPSQSQDKNSLAGKILRVTDEGKPAQGNPFNNLVYSYGHRNPQGIIWDKDGNLWETEHGPSGGSDGTGQDEINLIQVGNNYGWPVIRGDQSKEGMITPVKNSTSSVTWAPAGAAFFGNSLFFGGLKGQALFEAVIQNNKITEFTEHFKGKYGRIREVILGPDNMLYISTSNKDGRGKPVETDDRIIRINPEKL